MKNILTIFCFCICFTGVSQEEKDKQSSELNAFVLQCRQIGDILVDKTLTSDISKWYEGKNQELAAQKINELELDIDKSELEVTYFLNLVSSDPLLFNFQFYNEATKNEFGHLFVYFDNRENTLVDDLKSVSKAKMEMLGIEPDKNTGLIALPPPPPPPPTKTKNKN